MAQLGSRDHYRTSRKGSGKEKSWGEASAMDLFLDVGLRGWGARGLQAYLETSWTDKGEGWSLGVLKEVTGRL